MSNSVVLGFDGGGTKCSGCALYSSRLDKDVFHSTFVNHSSTNQNSVGWDAAERSFQKVVEGLDLDGMTVDGVCMGMSGVSRPHEKERWKEIVEKTLGLPKEKIMVCNDATTALASGTGGSCVEGVVLISGTGTIAFGRREADGREERCQGWGPILGDVGSGYYLGSKALKCVMKSFDGIAKPTMLTEKVLEHANVSKPDELVAWTYSSLDWERFAALSPIVEQCALAGDEAAKDIMEKAAKGLES